MRDLAARVPADVRAELDAAVTVLERYGPAICGALHMLQRATFDANLAVEMRVASLDPSELADPTDAEQEALEAALAISRGWVAAFRVADAVHRVDA
jgi:hypothetical protein